MNPTTRHPRAGQHLARRIIAGATLVSFLATPPYAMAALTEVANAPLASASTAQIPPNIMFVLDASGSMDREFMPDWISGEYDSERVGSVSHLCNTLYYNPNVTYPTPKNANGTDFANASFNNAERDPYPSNDPNDSRDLRTKFRPWGGWDNDQRAFYFKYTGTGTGGAWPADPALRYDLCRESGSSADGNGNNGWTTGTNNWTKVEIPAAEETNFANWFSYYRTRLLLMKSAAGQAFNGLNDSFRVGFITICPQNGSSCNNDTTNYTVSSDQYLKIDGFTSTHKQAWYDKFYAQKGGSYTPLRQALSRVGRHFAGIKTGINSGMPDDPIQFSCQQNFAILTTDGYWNYGYGQKIDGSTMDQQDGNISVSPRPMFDGGQMAIREVYQRERHTFNRTKSGCSGGRRQITERIRVYERVINKDTSGTVISDDGDPGNQISDTTSVLVPCGNSTPPEPSEYWNPASAPGTLVSTSTGFTAGPLNSLADVAEYYYRTDLRPTGSTNAAGVDISQNNVPAAGIGTEDDKAQHQHMTTFTLGLGVSGQLNFQADYKNGSGDFAAIRNGSAWWPDTDSFNSSNDQNPARIDDLWHAAVNGRGQAFSATDPVSLAVSLQTALSAIQVRLSSAAAAATSSLEPTLTDRLVFTPTYTTGDWTGDVQAYEIDLTTGAVITSMTVWSAQALLDGRTKKLCDTRDIRLHRPGYMSDNLVPFTMGTYTDCDGAGAPSGSAATDLDLTEQGWFGAAAVTGFTQFGLMTNGTLATVDQPALAAGANLVNFVRGQRGFEDFAPNSDTQLYRLRKHVLGDIVNSQPVYVRQPYFDYKDAGYLDSVSPPAVGFKSTQSGRIPMVYVTANDGMLHAFYAGTSTSDPDRGKEAWAIIPREVGQRLHRQADTNWAKLHEYTVDATPTVGDVFDTTSMTWRTILVAGLNKGGRAYYAVDVTDPLAPKMLWEFNSANDSDLGYTFGNPIISKLENGQWVVFATSGLNNVAPGDGQGYLYVLDAMTGAIVHKIGTGVGESVTPSPSGLTKIRNWVSGNGAQDNTTSRVYGVDLEGNIWRFDVNNHLGIVAGPKAELLARVMDDTTPTPQPQPLTTRPELAEVGSPPVPFVYVSTGRYLGPSDVSDVQTQSVYAIKDIGAMTPAIPSTPYGDLRTELTKRTMTTVGTERFTCTGAQQSAGDPTCDPASPKGWYVDLIDSGERVNVDMKLQLGTLIVASNVPANTSCEPGGYSYKNYFDYATGLAPDGPTQPVGSRLSNALAVGINVIRLPDGRLVVIGMDSSGTPQTFDAPFGGDKPSGKRITWREIAQ